jgi:uncharacterized peroxidase-related enzyme
MPYITTIEPEDAQGPLADVYQRILKARGHLANIYKLSSLSPELLQRHYDMYMTQLMAPDGLSLLEREAVAAAVSVANECAYAMHAHLTALREEGGDDELIGAIEEGAEPDLAPKRLKRLVYFARKLTLLPNSMSRQDIEDLRMAGLGDLEILQAVQLTAYFNYVNRLATALGVDIEQD